MDIKTALLSHVLASCSAQCGERAAAFIESWEETEEEGRRGVSRYRPLPTLNYQPPLFSSPHPGTDVPQTQPRTSHLLLRSYQAIGGGGRGGGGGPPLSLFPYIYVYNRIPSSRAP